MNNPPFSIGQKVVCLTTFTGYIYKDRVYTIAELGYCEKHKLWHVSLFELPIELPSIDRKRFECLYCDKIVIPNNRFKGCTSKHFAPIVTNYSDATSEILEKFKSPAETPDKILTPEKVLLNQ